MVKHAVRRSLRSLTCRFINRGVTEKGLQTVCIATQQHNSSCWHKQYDAYKAAAARARGSCVPASYSTSGAALPNPPLWGCCISDIPCLCPVLRGRRACCASLGRINTDTGRAGCRRVETRAQREAHTHAVGYGSKKKRVTFSAHLPKRSSFSFLKTSFSYRQSPNPSLHQLHVNCSTG